MTAHLTPTDLAEQVVASLPNGTLTEWGAELINLARFHGMDFWLDQRLTQSCGAFAKNTYQQLEQRRQAERLVARGVTYSGKPMSSTISIKNDDGSRQTVLWIDASPAAFIEAVLTEQAVIRGRQDANSLRFQVVEMLQDDPTLRELPTLGAVCEACGIDPDTLGLDELAV